MLRGSVALLLAVALIPMASGCARHGLLLRGDWSLEVNRTPWLADRSVVQEDCSEGSCATGACEAGPTCGVSPGCGAGMASGCLRPGCANCRPRRGAGNDAALAQANYHNHPRFHPVPTQPAFTPRANPLPTGPVVMPASDVELPAPMPAPTPAPEAAPIPSGEIPQAWRPRPAGPMAGTALQQSWVFVPAEETPPEVSEASPTRQVSLSKTPRTQQRSRPVR